MAPCATPSETAQGPGSAEPPNTLRSESQATVGLPTFSGKPRLFQRPAAQTTGDVRPRRGTCVSNPAGRDTGLCR